MRTSIAAATTILACGVGGVAGFAVGQRQGMAWGIAGLEREVGGGLSRDVEVASCIRVGDPERALSLLEPAIDRSVLSLVAHPGAGVRGLGQAALYRRIVPSTGPGAREVEAALAGVPPLQPLDLRDGAADRSSKRSGLSRLADGAAEER